MTLQPEKIAQVPAETARVAKAAFPKGNLCLKVRDEIGTIYEDAAFAELYSKEGQPGLAPWRLALITVLQFMEGLSDRQGAEMVRSRIDWKYALGLELSDSGFDYTVLCEFRGRLLKGSVEELLLDRLLEQLRERKLIKAKGKQRTDSTQVIASVRLLNRLEMIGETLRAALNSLAATAPQWLVGQIPEEWYDLYGRRIENYRLPEKEQAREGWALDVGVAGYSLWQTLGKNEELQWVRRLPALEALRQVWVQQFYEEAGNVYLRTPEQLPPPGKRLHSPYDVEARYATKREVHWLGYKVHLTETCERNSPNLITQVYTTPGTVPDVKALEPIQQALVDKGLPPAQHIVDQGYVSAEEMLKSRNQHQIELCGELREDASWQNLAGSGYAISDFQLDWVQQQARCPEGKLSRKWTPKTDNKGCEYIQVRFAKKDCKECKAKELCTKRAEGLRKLCVRPQPAYGVIEQQHQKQGTAEFKELLDLRAGVEGTISQGVRVAELRECRYLGLAKTHLQQVASAVALNLVRLYDWLEDVPRATTRVSRFAALKPVA
jgi:transposase